MIVQKKDKVRLVLFQRDFFTKRRRVFNKISLINRNNINYLPLRDVLEILEFDNFKVTPRTITVTDGSEFVVIPKKGITAQKEGISLNIDRVITINNVQFISVRSINRLFNVDLTYNALKKQVCIRQPGRFFIVLRGDTLRIIAMLLNTSIKGVLSINKNLREPLPEGIKIKIPTMDIDTLPKNRVKSNKAAKIKQQPELASKITALGRTLIGIPYKFGAGPYPRSKRFDCSSYIQYIFGKNGIRLPRTSRAQSRSGRSIKQSDVEPGDLIFFRRDRYSDNRIGHVGMDIGKGKMLNTYQSPPGVTITRWKTPYWLRRYVTAREVL